MRNGEHVLNTNLSRSSRGVKGEINKQRRSGNKE